MEPTEQRRWIAEVKAEWHEMWERRLEDEERAEGIADKDYSLLFVEKGLVIYATRACRPPRLDEILGAHGVEDAVVRAPPPSVGGWRKFMKTVLSRQIVRRPPVVKLEAVDRGASLQLKKGGRGWLHVR